MPDRAQIKEGADATKYLLVGSYSDRDPMLQWYVTNDKCDVLDAGWLEACEVAGKLLLPRPSHYWHITKKVGGRACLPACLPACPCVHAVHTHSARGVGCARVACHLARACLCLCYPERLVW